MKRQASLFASMFNGWSRSARSVLTRTIRQPRRTLSVELLEGRDLPAAGIREQYMVELVNRMRAAPSAELPILLAQADVKAALTYFNVNQTALTQSWAALTAQAPLAWSDQIATAALTHTQAMLTADTQSHQLPNEASLGDRITAAGYVLANAGENVFARASSINNAHAAFAIDWGLGANGLQNPAGHRDNIMNAAYTDIGIGILDTTAGKKSGPLLITQNFGSLQAPGNPYVLGVVYNDANNNGFYDMGEGLADVDVTINVAGAPIALKTSAAGYYQARVAAGAYDITASGGGLAAPITHQVTVAAVNVKSDFKAATGQAPAQISLVGPISVKEDAGTLQVKVSRAGNLAATLTVNFAATDGTAKSPANFTVVTPSPLTFAANETEKTIEITIVNQPNVFTGNLGFDLALSNPSSGATLVNAKATATIIDNDAAPKFTLSLVNGANSQIAENGGPLKVKVSYNGGAGGGVTLSTADGTATSPTDYTATDQNLVFNAAGDQIIDVPIIDNTIVDGNRTFTVKLTNPALGTLAAPSVLLVTILDDDVAQANATVSIGAAALEVAKTSPGLTLSITRTATGAPASVRVKTGGGTALAGTDYTAVDQVVNFAANESVKTVSLAPTGNSVGDKTIDVSLSESTGVTLGVPSTVTITIKDTAVVNPIPNGNAPTAVADFFVVRRGDAASDAPSVLANDTGNPTSAKIVKNPTEGTVTLNPDGTFTYRPGPNFSGFDTFTYQATNAQGDSSEVAVTVMTHEALQIRKLYKQVLGREPDAPGWRGWTSLLQSGKGSLGTVASGIFESVERLNPLITQFYRDYLGRDPEPTGLAGWRGLWQRTGGPEDVISGILASKEFFIRAGNTNTAWVTQLYRNLLGRDPEEAGLNNYLAAIARGMPLAQIVLGFINSPEKRGLLAKGWYQQYLNRAATQAEIDSVATRMANGATQRDIQIALLNGLEYYNTPLPPTAGSASRVV